MNISELSIRRPVLASVQTNIILLLAAFAAGWLFGRFGGKRRRSDDERNARNITQAQKK